MSPRMTQLPCDCKEEGDGIRRGDGPHINYFIVSHLLPDLKNTNIPPDLGANYQYERLFPIWTATLETWPAPPIFSKSQEREVYRARVRKMTRWIGPFYFALKLFSGWQSHFL